MGAVRAPEKCALDLGSEADNSVFYALGSYTHRGRKAGGPSMQRGPE